MNKSIASIFLVTLISLLDVVYAAGNPVNIDTGISKNLPKVVVENSSKNEKVKPIKNRPEKKILKKIIYRKKTVKFSNSKPKYLHSYQVNSGDVLNVTVWKESQLQGDVIVRPDGGISFPLIGDIKVSGKTIAEIQKIISLSLQHYIPESVVTVSIKKLSGNKIYIIGKVNRPGVFTMDRQTDVLQALSIAGGLTTHAESDEIKVIRRGADEQQTVYSFDYSKAKLGEGLIENRILQSGDVIVVP